MDLGVFHLKNAKVTNLTATLKKLLPRDLRAIELPASNTLIVLDTVQTMPTLRSIIQELDKNPADSLNREIIPCRHIAPS